MRERAQGLAPGAHTVGENLRDEHPDDGTLSEGVRGDEAEQSEEDQPDGSGAALLEVAVLVCEHHARQEAERDQVSDRAHDHELAAADAVDDGEGGHRSDQVHEADDDGSDVGEGIAQDCGAARELHDLGRVVEDRVDARELVEHRDAESHEDDLAVAAREEGNLAAGGVLGDLCLDFADLLVAFGLRGGETLGNLHGKFFAAVREQPARRLGDGGQEDQEEDRRNGHDAEHPPPGSLLVRDLADNSVRRVGQEDTEDDIELDEADQASAHTCGRDLGGVNGRHNGGQAHADAAEEAEDHEEGDRERRRGRHRSIRRAHQRGQRGQGGSERSEAKEDTDPEEDGLTAESVGQVTGDDCTENRTDRRDRDDHAFARGGQGVELGEFFFRAGDDGGIKTEEQATEGGDDRASNDQGRNGSRWC